MSLFRIHRPRCDTYVYSCWTLVIYPDLHKVIANYSEHISSFFTWKNEGALPIRIEPGGRPLVYPRLKGGQRHRVAVVDEGKMSRA